jgi:ATP-binding cassette subfamily C protein CydD
VLLDEPSSALDAASEARLIAGIRALADQGRAVVVVTHRGPLAGAADAELRLDGRGPAPVDAPAASGPARIAPAPAWRAQVAP